MLLFLSWCIITGWKSLDKVAELSFPLYDDIQFFLSATVLPFFISIIIFFSMVCGVSKKMERGKWVLTVSTVERDKIILSFQVFRKKFLQNHWFLKSSQTPFTCSKSTMETRKECMESMATERSQCRCTSVFIVIFEDISYIVPVFPLLTLKK